MKRMLLVVFLALAVFVGTAPAGPKEFQKGRFYLTPQIGLNSWGGGLPFGVNGEYAMTENIGVAGTAMFNTWSETHWSQTLINLAAEVNYHFTKIAVKKLDVYAGGGLGYSIYSWKWKDSGVGSEGGSGSSGIYIQTVIGGRYYFNPKIAAGLRLVGSLVGHWAGFGATIGVTFILK